MWYLMLICLLIVACCGWLISHLNLLDYRKRLVAGTEALDEASDYMKKLNDKIDELQHKLDTCYELLDDDLKYVVLKEDDQ